MAALTRAEFIRRSYQLAGLLEVSQSPSDYDSALAVDMLGLELDALQAEHIVLKTSERTTKTLAASTAAYTLDTDCMDVNVGPDNVVGTVVPSGGTETHVRILSQHEYLEITDKTTEGTPTRCLIERQDTITATFWPVPDAVYTFNYVKQAAFESTSLVARRWQLAVMHMVAHRLALVKSVPLARVGYLRGEADKLKAIAKSDDVTHGHQQLVIEEY